MNLKWLLTRLTHERRQLIATVGLSAVNVACLIGGPLIVAAIINRIFAGVIGSTLPADTSIAEAVGQLRDNGHGTFADVVEGSGAVPGSGIDFGALWPLLGLLVSVYVAGSLCSWLGARTINNVAQRAMNRLRADIESHIHRMPITYFDTAERGQTLSKVTSDIDNVSSVFAPLFVKLPAAVLTVITLAVVMPVISWKLTLVVLVAIPFIVGAGIVFAKRARPHFLKQWTTTGNLTSHIDESYANLHTLRIYGAGDRAREEFEEITADLARSARTAQAHAGSISPVLQMITSISYISVTIVGTLQVLSGSMTIGQVQAFMSYSRMFNQPVNDLSAMMSQIQSALVSLGRVRSLLAEPTEIAPAVDDSPVPTIGSHRGPPTIDFDTVRFSYRRAPDSGPTKPVDVIDGLSLHIPSGATVAVVGPTGAGKTTLTNLLLRLYDPGAGSIRVDGESIEDTARSVVRDQSAIVTQDRWLFTGTIAENIAFGHPGATDADVESAAEDSHVAQFVDTLPDGFDTVIGDGGSTLSEGQLQLITIARAMIARPRILVLDEATSAVDSRTELLIARALETLRSRTTTIVVAHRLSTIRDADIIAVVDGGTIVEQGTHTELLDLGGRYAVMYKSQFE